MSKEYKPISEEDFYNKYKPVVNPIARKMFGSEIADEDVAPYGGAMIETYGEEYDHIRQLIKEGKIKHIWTVVDAEGELIIQTGHWFVNRMGYIVTEQPWEEEGVHVEED